MNEFGKKIGNMLITLFVIVLLILASPFIIIFLIVGTIKDYIAYKKSRYYEDTNEKYSWMCGRTDYITFYGAIKDTGVPVEYYRNTNVGQTGYGYFVYDDALILCDYDSDTVYFDKDENDWLIYDEHDYMLLEPWIDEEIKVANEFLGEERCKQAYVFIESETMVGVPDKQYEKIVFLPTIDDNKISTLIDFIK